MEIKDLSGLSKPLTKLIEVVSKGVGAISKPYLIKKTADAKAYEMKKIAETIKEHQETLKTINYDDTKLSLQSIENSEIHSDKIPIEDRVTRRTEFQEQKRQSNIESITQKTVGYVENEKEVSEEEVSEDWTNRFFNYAQDISDDEMQELWARILAGEVVRPGSFSLRTLELIRNLSKKEAETFTRIANLTITSFNRPCVFKGNGNNDEFLTKFGCNFEDRLLLVELGLLQADTMITRNIPANDSDKPMYVYHDSGNVLIKQTINPKAPKSNIPIYRYSKIGEELLDIILPQANMDYLKVFGDYLRTKNSEAEYAFILIKLNDGNFQHSLPWNKLTTANNAL
jgi:uncharacterized repeat protein (TIGR03899 family)